MSPQKFILSFSHKILDICEERGTPARPSSVFGFYSIFTVYQTASTNSSTAAPQIT